MKTDQKSKMSEKVNEIKFLNVVDVLHLRILIWIKTLISTDNMVVKLVIYYLALF